MKTYPLVILTPERRVYENAVTAVTVSCEDGQLTVLAGHASMVALLAGGPMTIRIGRETLEGVAGRGVLRVGCGETAVLVHSFQWAGEENAPPAPGADAQDEAAGLL